MRLKLLVLLAFCLVFVSCKMGQNSSSTLQISEKYRTLIDSNFSALCLNYPQDVCKEIFSVDSYLNGNEKLAFRFLYAYMPPSDIADYSPEFFHQIVKKTFEVRQFFSWSKKIPDDIFLHFVLPYRVNNENLDTSRSYFFNQLKDRLKNRSMLDAAMEVNHWCHEHVAYQAADERTSSPLATYFNGLGRCGEESTFTVSALRAVGIPARQVYTPRWAHTDDNHAWVEFWADGKWYFFGACEPESVPNLGWFSEPSRRAMLVNTRVIGNYDEVENVLERKPKYSILNSLEVYAKTKNVNVFVFDKNGIALDSARVDFQLYNYAEFYSLTTQYTDSKGMVSFKTGFGDLLVWVSKDSLFAFQKINALATDTLKIMLSASNFEAVVDFDYNPPIAPEPIIVNQKNAEINKKRLLYEDSLRAIWEASFIDSTEAVALASELEIKDVRFLNIIINARANHAVILEFLREVDTKLRVEAIDLLAVLPEKDLHDIQLFTLQNHLNACVKFSKEMGITQDVYNSFLLNPHVANELVRSWRGELKSSFEKFGCKNLPEALAWIHTNISFLNENDYDGVPISPIGVIKIGKADLHSLRILKVAVCRDYGFAARLEPGSLQAQYFENGKWITIDALDKAKSNKMAFAEFVDMRKKKDGDLQYYKHFTLAKFSNGRFETLEFEWDKALVDFEKNIALEPGYYRLTTGNRRADGSVLCEFKFYNLLPSQKTKILVDIRTETNKLNPLANFSLFNQLKSEAACSYKTKWNVVMYLAPKSETSKHCIQDVGNMAAQFNAKNISFILVLNGQYNQASLDKNYFSKLPKKSTIYSDIQQHWFVKITEQLGLSKNSELPIVFLLNENNEVFYVSTGYKIGLGDEILKIIASFE